LKSECRHALPLIAALAIFFAQLPVNAAEPSARVLRSPFENAVRRAAAFHAAPLPQTERTARILGGVAPHHDLALPMIVRFYERVSAGFSGDETRRVWLFAPDHFRMVRKLAAVCDEDWSLSERLLKADREALEALKAMEIVEANAAIFAGEHGITLHIPLIARYFPNAVVVPILLSPKIPDVGLIILKNRIKGLLREGDIIILSMDLSHYKTPEAMAACDEKTLAVLKEMRSGETGTIDVDAPRAAALALSLLRCMGAKEGNVLERSDSSSILGRRVESGTSYAAVTYGSFR
jgi:AmmeMemoRadiSam system protein B